MLRLCLNATLDRPNALRLIESRGPPPPSVDLEELRLTCGYFILGSAFAGPFSWALQMSFISLVFGLGGPQTTIGALPLDALLSEVTELPSNISAYAVEDGPPVTDHITQDAERLSLSGVVTAASIIMFGAGGRSKLIAAKEALRQIHEQRLPLTIVTGMDMYENMGMSNAKIGRTNKSDQLTIDCEFQKIRKATIKQADIPSKQVSGSAKGKAGKTAAKGGKVSTDAVNQKPATELSGRLGIGK